MKDKTLLKKKNIHFVGIGGIGMSGIARILLDMKYDISGSDLESSGITRKLEDAGGRIYRGHSASNVSRQTEMLVYSSSISKDNPELKEARRRKITIAHRAEVLGELFNSKAGIAITGTHGKTTTSSLISVMLKEAGLDPTIIVGGEVASLDGNAHLGMGAYMVAEADESDSSFLHLKPFYTVITNIEMEHLDHFKTLKKIKAAYTDFISNTKNGGTVFYNIEDRNLREVIPHGKVKLRSFGFSKRADIYPKNIRMTGFKTSFDCVCDGLTLGKVSIRIPGRHNVLNSLAAILVGLELGLKFKKILRAIKYFEGAKRRFQFMADVDGVMLIDDYAHHPTEVRAVLDASRNWKRRRLIVVFQPHRYSRTKFFADDFGKCFKDVDKLILTDIYAASEKAIEGVSVRCLYDKARANGLKDIKILKKENIPGYLIGMKRPGDMIIVMGAGDIKEVASELCEMLLAEKRLKSETIEMLRRIARGKIKVNEPLSSHTSFKIGARARAWFEPRDENDLKRVLAFAGKKQAPFLVIGNGSNILARDTGFNGILIHLGSGNFKKIKFSGNTVRVGAGFSLAKLVNLCCQNGIAGLESMVGIPGTVGGAIYMNAGGWTNPIFRNIGETVKALKVISPEGKIKILKKGDLKFDYRHSNLENYIILEAELELRDGDRGALTSSASRFLKMKMEKQVLDTPSAGCVFKNPTDFQFTCGQMIEMLGLKGTRIGGAQISMKHGNFIVNNGGATCKDVLDLAELMKKIVKENYGIELEFEVKMV